MANEPKVSAARKAAEAIEKMVAIWLEKMNLPITNKQGREIFCQTLEDIIEAACSQPVAPGRLLTAAKRLLGLTNTIEVLGEWEALDINFGLRKKERPIVDAAIAELRAAIDETLAALPQVSTPPDLLSALKGLVALFIEPSKFYIKKLGTPITNGDQAIIDKAFIAADNAIKQAEAGAVSTPRCPNGCEQDLRIAKGRGECQICGHLADWQFFQPVSQPSPWVSVKERMPEFTKEIKSNGLRYSDELLVFDAGGTGAIIQATLNQFDGKSAKWVSDHMGSELHRVTHWMPLPAQPSPRRREQAVSALKPYYGDPCPTGEHIGGYCCHACDHDYPVSCVCLMMDDPPAAPGSQPASGAKEPRS